MVAGILLTCLAFGVAGGCSGGAQSPDSSSSGSGAGEDTTGSGAGENSGASSSTGTTSGTTGGGMEGCTAGSEGCACYPNDTCDDDLVCLSGLCVDAGSGASSGAGGTTGSNGSMAGAGATTGSGASGSTTTGAGGGATGAGGTGAGGDEVTDAQIIDNFGSCDSNIARVAGRDGFWYVFGDNDVNLTPNTTGANPQPAASAPPTQFSDSSCAAWATGGCAPAADACTFGGVGFAFRADETPYSIAGSAGLSFDFEGDDLFMLVYMTQGRVYGASVSGSPGGRNPRTLSFASLAPQQGSEGTLLDLSQVIKIEFTTTIPSMFGQAVWNVRLY